MAVVCRILQYSRDYSTKRVAFGKYLADYPLHMRTLAHMEVAHTTLHCHATVPYTLWP